MSIVEIKIDVGSPALDRPLRELGIPDDCVLALVVRGEGQAMVPYGDSRLESGDHVIAVSSEASEQKLRQILQGR